ncbi:mannose-1-phosphate guanylyltransferase/mannose-6-phosphate isomerase [Ahniella affigens]|uniref:Xanthan biosynthesis protein XanB n=2 Tax=Ahniella affigens TaxID=2021234 RepID=A0A2P1PZ83_9GAMM|nr:mannose-1-phosphate guanylyltransferase/mannose-6-phosphate isomerase [Ahniella affigens]
MIPVILSGGAGTRLWPVSRRSYPKPFMSLPDGETLLEKTAKRALAVADAAAPIITVTARDYGFITRDAYAGIAGFAPERQVMLLEPIARNTAPAILAAALWVQARYGDDAQILVLPADHLIRDLDAFKEAVQRAERLAADGYLGTFGVVPTRPETGYGYIERGPALRESGFEVARFVEKPDLQTAQKYLSSGGFYWNSGMFCFRAGTLLDVANQVCPEVLAPTRGTIQTDHDAASQVLNLDALKQVPDISIDYAIMERATHRAVVPAAFDWSDIGSWNALADLVDADEVGNRRLGNAVFVGAARNYVQSPKRVIAAVGVSDLMIIDTDDALLVAHREQSQSVKQVVDALKQAKHHSTELHTTVYRPWGSYTVLEDADDCKVKRLVVKPGHVLSLQKHHRRSEHWTVVSGTALVRIGDQEFDLRQNQSCYIPIDTLHRLENRTDQDLALIEVQCGDYFGEDDIVRLEDRYGRV